LLPGLIDEGRLHEFERACRRTLGGSLMRVTVVRPEELGPAELDRWRQIMGSSSELENPFLCPEFILALAGVRRDVFTGVIEDAGGIVGFFPFQRSRFRIGRAAGHGLTDWQAPVISADVQIDAVWLIRQCDLVVWEYDRLQSTEPTFTASQRTRWRSLAIDLSAGFEHYVRNRKRARGTLISDTQRKLRKLDRDTGSVAFEFDPPGLDPLRWVMHAKSAQYQRTGLSDRFAEAWVVQLIETLHETRTPDFALVVPTLTSGGSWVAGNIMLRFRETLSGWFPAYDLDRARYSPGMLHRLKCLEAAATAQVRRVELGREGQPHKERWATTETILFEGAVEQPTLTALARRAQREPLRALRTVVVKNPRLYDSARCTLARIRGRPGAAR
jgi:CelD/BcsL family acetyltransferase involved in cellulose biosynthesis